MPGIESPLRALSKGNAQKVALAQALIVPPDLLILDEPWTGLDDIGRLTLTGVIEETAVRGGTVVFSSHPTVAAPTLPVSPGRDSPAQSRSYVLADGKLTGTPVVPAPVAAIAKVVLRPRSGRLICPNPGWPWR